LVPDLCKLETKHIKKIGISPILKGKIKETFDGDVPCPWFLRYKEYSGDDTFDRLSDYKRSVANESRFNKSFMKCDVPAIKPPDDDIFWRTAQEYTLRMFHRLRGSRPVENFEINEHTSPGKPFTSMGFKTKGELLADPSFGKELRDRFVPIWSINEKFEFLLKDDVINRDKLRTFFIPDLPFLVHQKILFDDQNKRILNQCNDFENFWARYGFVKQFGGFDDLMKFHEGNGEFDIHLTTDIQGYDRVNATLEEVYQQRVYYLDPGKVRDPKEWESYVQYVVDNTTHPYVCHPDGSIYRRMCGNGSGSNDTTPDNCWSHVMIFFYVLLKLGYAAYERILSYEEILHNARVSLYGDDNFASLKSKFWFPNGFEVELFKTLVKEAYRDFQMEIKDSQFAVKQGTVEGLEFLGSTAWFSKKHNMYLPRPRLGKITTSLSQVLEGKEEQGVVNTIKAAYDMVAEIEEPDELSVKKSLQDYSHFLLRQEDFMSKINSADSYYLELITTGKLSTKTLIRGHESVGEKFSVDLKRTDKQEHVLLSAIFE